MLLQIYFYISQTFARSSRLHEFTGMEFIDFWLKSVYTYTSLESSPREGKETKSLGAIPKGTDDSDQQHMSPPVLIVGTHQHDFRKQLGANDKVRNKFAVALCQNHQALSSQIFCHRFFDIL